MENKRDVSLLNPNDLTKGLVIMYDGGDLCEYSENPMEIGL
jgi:hypothetical protein